MSYDIRLKNKATGETARKKHPQYVRGGTVRAVMDERTGQLVQAEQVEADINITYNYSQYYADGTQGPIKTEYGIRGLYGATPAESIPMLIDMIEKIKAKYTDESGEWIDTERTKTVYYKNGRQISEKHVIDAIMHKDYDDKKEVTYMVNEGDMSDYWQATAANAIKPLQDMIVMATDNLTEKGIVWDGD